MSALRDSCRRRLVRRGGDRGSVSTFFVVAGVGLLLSIGLVVDGGGRIRALQRADAAAAEAARQGGQAVAAGPAIRGESVQVQAAVARSAAAAYLAKAGVSGSVTVADGTRVVVTTSTSYEPVFLDLVGIGTMTTTGRGEVRLVRGLGTER